MFKTELNPGDVAYSFFFHTWFIVPVIIIETNTHFSIDNNHYTYCKNQETRYIYYSSSEFITETNSWGFKYVTDEQEIAVLLNKCTSQGDTFYWLDEPVGHSLTLEDDGLFKTLQEAMNVTLPLDKRSRKRKHKKVANLRTKIFQSLNRQNIDAGSDPIENIQEKLIKLNKKPVYCRKR